MWECKSGHTLEEKQAKVYAAASAEDVQRTGNITFPNPSHATIQAAYCCLKENADGITDALNRFAPGVPVVALGEKAILASGQFRDRELTTIFTEGVSLPPLEEVPRFLKANTQTAKASIARDVLASLVSFLHKQSRKMTVEQVLSETFPDWACMGTDLRRHLTSTAKEILIEACSAELKDYARVLRQRNVAGAHVVELTIDVLGQDATARTRLYQKLTRKAELFVERTAEGRSFEPNKEPESLWLPGLEPD